MLQLISLLVENKPGALMRVTGLLTARGYNIESLTVARTLDPELSRMSIVVDIEPQQRAQVIKQMNKLINVLQATDLTETPGGAPRTGAAARARDHAESHGHPEGSRDFRRARGGFLDRRIRARSHRRSGKARRIYRRDASYGEIEVTRSGLVAVSLEAKKLKLAPPVKKNRNRIRTERNARHEMAKRFYEKDGNFAAEREDHRHYRLWQPGPRARAESARFGRRRGGRVVSRQQELGQGRSGRACA